MKIRKTIHIFCLLSTAVMAGCSLDSPIKYGMDCEASSIQLESGKICMPGECPNYDVYLENKACPADAPYCVAKDGRQYCSFLRQTCEASFVMLANGERYEYGQNVKYDTYLSNQICPIEAPYCRGTGNAKFCSAAKPCDAVHIVLSDGHRYQPGENIDYDFYFNNQICPADAPYCRTESGRTFCAELREDCPHGTYWTGNECKTGTYCAGFEFIFVDEMMIFEKNKYYTNFSYSVCPSEAPFCMTLGEIKTSSADIREQRYCSDRRDKCPDGAHWFEGMCERDTAEHCGSHDNNCLRRENGIAKSECEDKTCIAIECLDSYYLIEGECRISSECCGTYCEDCTVLQKVCISDENMNTFCSDGCPGNATLECNGVCIDPMTSLAYCGSDNCELRYCPNIVEGWRNGSCVQGECKVRDCLAGYHLIENVEGKTLCEKDSPEACGESGLNCIDEIENAEIVDCVVGECVVSKCQDGYYPYNDKCIEIPDGQCGDIYCSLNEVCNEDTHTCTCKPGFEECDGVCYNLKSNLFHCGDCNTGCHGAHAEFSCTDGQCVLSSCHAGYHEHDNGCEADDMENCGEHGAPCDSTVIPNGASFSCDDGKCKVNQCDLNYHLYENTCEEDTAEHCGSHENSCPSVDGGTYHCQSLTKTCELLCNKGNHIYEGGCESDDLDNCGRHGNSCSIDYSCCIDLDGIAACEKPGGSTIKLCTPTREHE